MYSLLTMSPCPATPEPSSCRWVSPAQESNTSESAHEQSTPPRHFSLNSIDEETRKRKLRSPRQVIVSPPGKLQKTPDKFDSVLNHPFVYWTELDRVLEVGLTPLDSSWKHNDVRGQMIHHLIHFLELKVALNLYLSECMLIPTPILDQAWRTLVLDTNLYQQITSYIQDFHGRPRRTIPYSSLKSLEASKLEQHDKLQRTQALFQVYFTETMPTSMSQLQGKNPSPSVFLLPRYSRNSTVHSMVDLYQPMLENDEDEDEDDLFGLNLIE